MTNSESRAVSGSQPRSVSRSTSQGVAQGVSQSVEIEAKFDVDATAVMPSLEGVGPIVCQSGTEVEELDATYFDTPSLLLVEHRITLRRRLGGHDAGWHIKLPPAGAQALGRREIRVPLCADDPESLRIPERIVDALNEALRSSDALRGDDAPVDSRDLTPLARLHNTRTITRYADANGSPVAAACDDRVKAESYRTTPPTQRRWREWEVELAYDPDKTTQVGVSNPDSKELLDLVADRLTSAGATRSDSPSKLLRALS